MKKAIVTVLSFALVLALSSCMKFEKLDFDASGAPSIKNIPRQKMLIAEAKGDPDKTSMECIGTLYRMYFEMEMKDKVMVAPRARWTMPVDKPRDEWVGIFGLPIPGEINTIPVAKTKLPVEVKIGYWEYGEVAEIVHKGSYDSEKATVEKLMQYIKEKGYKITGPHEEIYMKGPGMFGRGNPAKYITIIRYEIGKESVKGKHQKK
jgi:hypothetical protein